MGVRAPRQLAPEPGGDEVREPSRFGVFPRGEALSLTLSILLLVAVVLVIVFHPGVASPYGTQVLSSNQSSGTLAMDSPTTPPGLPTLPARPMINPYAVLFAVDTAGPNAVWAAGRALDASGQQISLLAYHSDGAWTQDNDPVATIPHATLFGIALVTATEGWAVGGSFDVPYLDSVILHYIGGRWIRIPSPTNATLRAVSMDAPDDGWAAGQSGNTPGGRTLLLHYDGARWRVVPTALHASIAAIDMRAANDGWAAGGDEQGMLLLHYDGLQWAPVPTPFDHTATAELTGISLADDGSGWAVGDISGPTYHAVLLSYRDGQWRQVPAPLPTAHFFAVRALASNGAWAVGDTTDPSYHSVLLHFQNGSWQSLASPANATLRAIAFSSPDTGWAVGGLPNGGLILHDANGVWRGDDS